MSDKTQCRPWAATGALRVRSYKMGARLSRMSSKNYIRLPSSEYDADLHSNVPLERGLSEDSNEDSDETLNPEIARLNLTTLARVAGADIPTSQPDSVRRTGSVSRGSEWQVQSHRRPNPADAASSAASEETDVSRQMKSQQRLVITAR